MTYSNRIAASAVLGLTLILFAPAVPARAAVGWSVGSHFSVGPFDFDLYFQSGRPDHYFYRTPRPIHYRGVTCSDACYHRAGYDYHHASCPVVDFHFRRYGFQPFRILGPVFYPRGYRYPDYRYRAPGYRGHGGYHRGPYTYRSQPGPYRRGYRGDPRYRGKHGDRYYRYDRDADSDSDRRGYRGRRYQEDRYRDDGRNRRRGRDTRPYRRD